MAAAFAGWRWLRTRSGAGELPYPLRRMLEFNEELAESTFRDSRLAPTFPEAMPMMAFRPCGYGWFSGI